MPIEWTQRLAFGVGSIDRQHRELFDRVNDLLAAMTSQQSSAEVQRMIGFLESYVVSHFANEEQLMLRHAYPDREAHEKDHRDFVEQFGRVRAQLLVKTDGLSHASNIELNQLVCDWLIKHVSGMDRRLGAFLSAEMSVAEGSGT